MTTDGTITLRSAARSHTGLVRKNNQDSGYAGPNFLLIADGMGGHAGGDDEQRNQHDQAQQVGDLLGDKIAAVVSVHLPHRGYADAQVVHPVQAGPQRSQQTDTGDGAALVDRLVDQLVEHLAKIAFDGRSDLVFNLRDQIRPRVEEKA